MEMSRRVEMREKMAELETQYRVRRLQEFRQAAAQEMLNLVAGPSLEKLNF